MANQSIYTINIIFTVQPSFGDLMHGFQITNQVVDAKL